jgi:hypothetical protein
LGTPKIKKTFQQTNAEKAGIVKDNAVQDQEKLANYGYNKITKSITQKASMGEKVDHTTMQEAMDLTLERIGLKDGTPERINAEKTLNERLLKDMQSR